MPFFHDLSSVHTPIGPYFVDHYRGIQIIYIYKYVHMYMLLCIHIYIYDILSIYKYIGDGLSSYTILARDIEILCNGQYLSQARFADGKDGS